jgi:hypothetical protein
MLKLIDKIPMSLLVTLAVLLAMVPIGAPHLWEKLGMLFGGTLSRPVDIFDLFMHGSPAVLLAIRLSRIKR